MLEISNLLNCVKRPISLGICNPFVSAPPAKSPTSIVARHSVNDVRKRKLQAICSGVVVVVVGVGASVGAGVAIGATVIVVVVSGVGALVGAGVAIGATVIEKATVGSEVGLAVEGTGDAVTRTASVGSRVGVGVAFVGNMIGLPPEVSSERTTTVTVTQMTTMTAIRMKANTTNMAMDPGRQYHFIGAILSPLLSSAWGTLVGAPS